MSRQNPTCRNPRCNEWLDGRMVFCPSCRWIARWAFVLGSVLAGALVKWLS